MAQLPRVELALNRVQELDPQYNAVQVEHFLAVLNTIRPPALGGDFDAGKAHYERALTLSEGKDLSINVDYARYYARTLYDRELHDRLLNEVMSAEPVQVHYVSLQVVRMISTRLWIAMITMPQSIQESLKYAATQ